MKKSIGFTVFLIILFIVLLVGRIVAGYFSDVLFLKELAKTLTWICIIEGILTLAFIVLIFIKSITGGKEE